MRYEFRIGMGFMFHSKGQTAFIVSAIALGVAVQVFIAAIITSVQTSLIDRVLGDSAHVYIEDGNIRDNLLSVEDGPLIYGNFPPVRNRIMEYQNVLDALKKYKGITYVVPTVEGSVIYKRQGKTTGLTIRGMDLNEGDRIYRIISRMVEGVPLTDSENVLIGVRLASDYELKTGDIMQLTLPEGTIQKVRIAGIFDLENSGSNTSLMIMDINRAQRLFNKKGYITHINMQFKDVFQAADVAKDLQKEFPDLEIVSWTRDGQNLLKALQSQNATTAIIQVVVMLATSMSIASVLLVTVLQKTREIGILKAMGALDKSTGLIFLVQGALIGFLGSALGILFGLGVIRIYILAAQPTFEIIVNFKKLISILTISTIAGMISAIVPAYKCMKLSPIEVIKGE